MHQFDDLLRPIQRNFKFGMLNFMDVSSKAKFWSFVPFFLLSSMFFGCSIFFYRNAADIENKIQDVAESGGVTGSTLSLFAKFLTFLLKRKEIISYSATIKRQYSKSLNEHPDIINAFARHFSYITKLLTVVVILIPLLYILASLPGDAKLPILMEFPYLPSKGWPNFYIFYCYQISIMWVACNIVLGIDLLTYFYIQYVCCRIEILSRMVERWNDNIKKSQGEFDHRKNSLLLQEIVRYHSSIKRNMDAYKSIFSPMVLATLLSNSIVICMCLIIISMNPVLKMLSHILFGFSETFMYCFVGNLLVKQNEKLAEKVMLVDFYYLNVAERKSYMNVIQNVCRPIKLQSFFVTVDMTLFFKVLKFAYSIFSLMKTRI